MELIDTHCHIDVDAFDADRKEVLEACQQAGVKQIIVPGTKVDAWEHQKKICTTFQGLFPAYGLHPVYIDHHSDDDLNALDQQLKIEKPLAVGEIGLDFYFRDMKNMDLNDQTRERQQYIFEEQLKLAQAHTLPVILHVRKAHDAVLSILKSNPVVGGICHAFNGSLEQAHRYLEMGFKFGFGGMLTYERSRKLHRLAKELPIDSIVLETDAPDMTVSSHHGERNSPEYLPECLAALAQLRNEDVNDIADQTTANANAVFKFT